MLSGLRRTKSKMLLALVMTTVFALALTGCGAPEEGAGAGGAGADQVITIGYVPWDCAIASTHVMKTVLEDAGFQVELIDPSASLLYEGLTTGDIDVITTAWLPFTHANYMDQVGDRVMDLGSNYSGEARIGLVVPAYMDVNSIEDLDGTVANGQIIGIDPGAGIMSAAQNAIDTYGLAYELLDGSDAAMAAALADAIANNEEIIVTGWSPHWKFGAWDLKFLDDPQETFGAIESIHTIARQGLDQDMPEAYQIINNFNWGDADIAAVMDMNAQGANPNASAREWVDANQDKVAQWLP